MDDVTIIINDYIIRLEQRSRVKQKEGSDIMNNLDIRLYVKDSGLLFKDVAEQMGVTPEYLSRVLRYQLKPDMRERILTAVRELRGESE